MSCATIARVLEPEPTRGTTEPHPALLCAVIALVVFARYPSGSRGAALQAKR